MRSSGEVFGLVAMRDPQRRVPPGTLWAPARNLVTPPEFRQAPRAAYGIAVLGTVADRYISADPQRHRFVAAFQDTAEILRVLGCRPSAAVPPIAARRWSDGCHDGRRTQAQDLSSRAALGQSGYFLRQLRMESAEDTGDRLQSRTSRNRRSLPAFGCKGMRKVRYGLGRIESLSAAMFSRAGRFDRAGISSHDCGHQNHRNQILYLRVARLLRGGDRRVTLRCIRSQQTDALRGEPWTHTRFTGRSVSSITSMSPSCTFSPALT